MAIVVLKTCSLKILYKQAGSKLYIQLVLIRQWSLCPYSNEIEAKNKNKLRQISIWHLILLLLSQRIFSLKILLFCVSYGCNCYSSVKNNSIRLPYPNIVGAYYLQQNILERVERGGGEGGGRSNRKKDL